MPTVHLVALQSSSPPSRERNPATFICGSVVSPWLLDFQVTSNYQGSGRENRDSLPQPGGDPRHFCPQSIVQTLSDCRGGCKGFVCMSRKEDSQMLALRMSVTQMMHLRCLWNTQVDTSKQRYQIEISYGQLEIGVWNSEAQTWLCIKSGRDCVKNSDF